MPGSALPILVGIMVIILDSSAGVVSGMGEFNEIGDGPAAAPVQSPPILMCGSETCPPKDMSPSHSPLDSGVPVMDFGWWHGFWSDSDSNGMDDRLQLILSGERESVSKTSIVGEDGDFVTFSLPPTTMEPHAGPPELDIHPGDRPTHEVSFMCDDLNATIEELRAKGVEFRGEPIDKGWGLVIVMVLPGGVEMVLEEAHTSDNA